MSNKAGRKGFTLIEVMIALVILLVLFLALMQTALVSIDANMTNLLMDEAVSVAEMRMSTVRNTPFASLAAGTSTATDIRSLRSASITYTTTTTITALNTDNLQVTITVTWTWKGQNKTHIISTILRRQ